MVYLALLGQVLISAGTYLVAKLALAAFGPFPLLAVRLWIAGLTFLPLVLLTPGPRLPPPGPGRRRELLALLGGPVNQAVFLVGMQGTTPTHAALLYALTPIGVYLYARLRRSERPGRLKLLGIAVAFAGVALVLASRAPGAAPGREAALWGDLTVLAAVAVWVAASVETKPIAARDGAIRAAGWSNLLGALALLPALPWVLSTGALGRAPADAWAAALYLGLGTSVLSYFLWFYALRRLDASKVAVFANLQPAATALLAHTLYGEPLPPPLLAGGALVVVGVLLTERG